MKYKYGAETAQRQRLNTRRFMQTWLMMYWKDDTECPLPNDFAEALQLEWTPDDEKLLKQAMQDNDGEGHHDQHEELFLQCLLLLNKEINACNEMHPEDEVNWKLNIALRKTVHKCLNQYDEEDSFADAGIIAEQLVNEDDLLEIFRDKPQLLIPHIKDWQNAQ